ncbi:MAG: hypothetical protein ACP5GW_06100, partial [Caldisericaceae bacterium]
ICYAKLSKIDSRSDKIDLLGQSILYFEKALSIFTLDDYPNEFAKASFELGMARREKFLQDKDTSFLEKEIENFKGVVGVFDQKKNPFTYLTAEFFIGESLYFLGKTNEAKAFYDDAEKIALQVDGKLASEIKEVIDSIWK